MNPTCLPAKYLSQLFDLHLLAESILTSEVVSMYIAIITCAPLT